MRPRASFLPALVFVAALPFTSGCRDSPTPEIVLDPIDLGVSVDLNDVVYLDALAPASSGFLAVGAEGTAVLWTRDWDTLDDSVDRFELGSEDLNAVASIGEDWWIVGDGGTVLHGKARGAIWTSLGLEGVSADLYGVADHGAWIVAVGDELVLLRGPEGVWSEAPAPVGGWGRLRAVYSDDTRVYAVGLDGAAWTAVDPGAPWQAENFGGELDGVDLHAVGPGPNEVERVAIAGDEGTLLFGRSGAGWIPFDTGTTHDFVDLDPGYWSPSYLPFGVTVLGAEGELIHNPLWASDEPPREKLRVPGARAVAGAFVVGEAGLAGYVEYAHVLEALRQEKEQL